MIKLHFTESTKKSVIDFVNKTMTKYAWVLRDGHIEILGLSDINYVYKQFATTHDYHIEYDIPKISIYPENI